MITFDELWKRSRLYRWLAWQRWWPKPSFKCRVCGTSLDSAPCWPFRGTCPEHCPEHDYEYDRDRRERACVHCGELMPYDLRGDW